MRNSELNIQKELEIIKQSFPPVAIALEKIIKTFSDKISSIGGDHGSRLTLVQTNSEKAISKANSIEKEFKKFKDLTTILEQAQKLTNHLQGKSDDIKILQTKINETNTRLALLESHYTDILNHSEVKNQTLCAMLEMINPAFTISKAVAIASLSTFPESIYEDILNEIEQKRATLPKTSEVFDETQKRITELVSDKYGL